MSKVPLQDPDGIEGTVLLVRWHDAAVYPAWRNDSPDNWTPEVCNTVGICVQGDEDTLTLAQTVSEGNVSTLVVIPTGCIEEFEVIYEYRIGYRLPEEYKAAAENHSAMGETEGGEDEPGSERDCS